MSGAERRPHEAELHAFVDEQLPAARRREIEGWLERDPELAARVAAWREQNRAIRELWGAVDADVPDRLRLAARRGARRRRLRALAASFALFVAGLGFGWLLGHADNPVRRMVFDTPRVAEQGVAAYRVYVSEVRHPVEVPASEEAHLVAWLSKRLAYPLVVPDLRQAGYRLVGGRLLPDDRGEPAAQFMFEDVAGDRITLYVARSHAPRRTAFRYVEENGVAAFYRYDGEIGYALVGPAERDRLLALARLVYDQLEARTANES